MSTKRVIRHGVDAYYFDINRHLANGEPWDQNAAQSLSAAEKAQASPSRLQGSHPECEPKILLPNDTNAIRIPRVRIQVIAITENYEDPS